MNLTGKMKTETEIAKENIKLILDLAKRIEERTDIKIDFKNKNVWLSEKGEQEVKTLEDMELWMVLMDKSGNAEQHKQTCERWLEWLENVLNRGLWRKEDAPSFRRKFKINEKIQDLKQAIKLYEKEGI